MDTNKNFLGCKEISAHCLAPTPTLNSPREQ
jgi:hypothetical protein